MGKGVRIVSIYTVLKTSEKEMSIEAYNELISRIDRRMDEIKESLKVMLTDYIIADAVQMDFGGLEQKFCNVVNSIPNETYHADVTELEREYNVLYEARRMFSQRLDAEKIL